ncbi:MAG: FGGY family carbohydrate kinase [Actinobacteria bacterium]|nr:FGGY family carbohydrate kinase [Actinomycetota bacterium]
MSLLVGIDLGTTGTKVVVVDPGVGVIGSATLPCTLSSVNPGWAEADTEQWWDNVCAAIPQALASAGVTATDISAVAASGMVPAVIPLDADGAVLRAAILQSDARASREIDALAAVLPPESELVARTGSALTQQSVAPTLLWLQRNEPEVWARTASLAGSYDWLARRLGARPHIEHNWAIESGLFELSGELAADVLSAAGIRGAILPPVERPGTVVGEVSRTAAEATGLKAGTAIVVGGADHVLSAYAAGLSEPGDWLVKLGGAGDVLVVTDEVFVDSRLYLDAHPNPGMWMPNGCMATSGSLLRWLQTTVSGDGPPIDLMQLDAEAEGRDPVSLVMLPYFLGEKSPLHDPLLRGAVVGLHLGTTRGDLHRAALEAIAYGFRQHVDVFAARGVVLNAAKVTNGGSKSTLWKHILASVLQRPLIPVLGHPGASSGAAFAAGIGVGLVPNWTAVNSLVRLGDPIEPDPAHVDTYNEGYEMFQELTSGLAPISHRLALRGRK